MKTSSLTAFEYSAVHYVDQIPLLDKLNSIFILRLQESQTDDSRIR